MKIINSILSWALFTILFVITLYVIDFASSTYALLDLFLAFIWFGIVGVIACLFIVKVL
jgi:hypothetical protein